MHRTVTKRTRTRLLKGKPRLGPQGPRSTVAARAYAQAGIEPAPVAVAGSVDGDQFSLDLLDVIGADIFGDGITASAVQALLPTGASVLPLRVRIDSPGGVASEGAAIRSILRAYSAETGMPVRVEIHGIAASAASIIAMAGDEIAMAPDALLMVHEASSFAFGAAEDMRHTADVLEIVNTSMANTYAARTGLDVDDVRVLMRAETWMTADDAIEQGFATEILTEPTALAAEPTERVAALLSDMHAPPQARDRYRTRRGTQLIAAMAARQPEPDTMHPQILSLLGLAPDTADATVIESLAGLKLEAHQATELASTLRAEASKLRAERDELASAGVAADVRHRLDTLQAQGKITPAECVSLASKFSVRSERGPLAVELFVEDLAELEARDVLTLAKPSGLDNRDAPRPNDPNIVDNAKRAMYGPSVSDEQIIATEKRFAQAEREAAGA